MDIAIVGGGIGGLALALALHQRGIPCRVYESTPEVKELGVGITLLPHAMRELTALGLGEALAAQGIENRESCFFNRFGQLIYAEPAAGPPAIRSRRWESIAVGCTWPCGTPQWRGSARRVFSRITSALGSTRATSA